jgi:hypothetical protein
MTVQCGELQVRAESASCTLPPLTSRNAESTVFAREEPLLPSFTGIPTPGRIHKPVM